MARSNGLTRLTLIRASLGRKWLRSALMVTSIAIAFFLFIVLGAFERGFSGTSGPSERLIVTNQAGSSLTLPLRQQDQIAALPGVALITGMARMRAYWRDPSQVMGVNAVDPESYAAFFADLYAFDPATIAALGNRRDGAIVGRAIADRMGWQVGQSVVLTALSEANQSGGHDWPVQIVGILDGRTAGADTNFVVVRYEYFNAGRAIGTDTVTSFGILPAAGVPASQVIQAIDARFANSAEATLTQAESDYQKAFVAQFADVSLIVRLVVSAAFVTILMIVANTMVFAIRVRRREIGVMKVLGFSGGAILRGVLAETVTLFALGLMIGLGLGAAAIALLAAPLSGIAPGLSLYPGLIVSAAALATLFALATGGLPALSALRIPPAAALKGA